MRGPKDAALSLAARAFFNRKFHTMGELTELTIDTSVQSVRLQVVLKGESEPIGVDVRRYAIGHSNDGPTLTLVETAASRPWVDEALRTFVVGHPLNIPNKAALALQLLA